MKKRDYGGVFDVDPEQYWTREDLDEVTSDVEDICGKKDLELYITGMYIKRDERTDADVFDIDYHYVVNEEHYYSSLFKNIKIDRRRAKTGSELAKVYAPEIADAIISETSFARNNDILC